jgi:DNA-binding HxlR family transcriptional regulator
LQDASYHVGVDPAAGFLLPGRTGHDAGMAERHPDNLTAVPPGPPPPAPTPAPTPGAEGPAPSALDRALSQVGDRWSFLLVDALLDGPRRFGELQAAVAGIATNVLTQRLRSLESARVVVARPYSRRPPRVAYELTSVGRELAGALRLLAQWGADAHTAPTAAHAACGTPLEARWWCPTCDRMVDDPGEGPLIFA